jgi:hypothetical protein
MPIPKQVSQQVLSYFGVSGAPLSFRHPEPGHGTRSYLADWGEASGVGSASTSDRDPEFYGFEFSVPSERGAEGQRRCPLLRRSRLGRYRGSPGVRASS